MVARVGVGMLVVLSRERRSEEVLAGNGMMSFISKALSFLCASI